MMKIASLCLGQEGMVGGRRPHRSGIFKHPVSGPVMIDSEGLVGDRIINRKHHGGPEQAVYIEGLADLEWWAKELGRDLPPGTFGENLVIEGLENRDLSAGDRLTIGAVVLEVTAARLPCATFAARMEDPKMVRRYTEAGRPGAYCRVLAEGMIEAGQSVFKTGFAGARVPIAEMMANAGKPLADADLARYLAAPIHAKLRHLLENQAAVK